MGYPTSAILLEFFKETFTYRGNDSYNLSINDFIRYYDKIIEQRMAQTDYL